MRISVAALGVANCSTALPQTHNWVTGSIPKWVVDCGSIIKFNFVLQMICVIIESFKL